MTPRASREWTGAPPVVTLEDLVQQLVERGGSDLHLAAGSAPMIRINGRLVATDCEILDSESVKKVIYSILDNEQIRTFEKNQELDMGFGISGLGRFRTNVMYQRGSVGAVLRLTNVSRRLRSALGTLNSSRP